MSHILKKWRRKNLNSASLENFNMFSQVLDGGKMNDGKRDQMRRVDEESVEVYAQKEG